MKKTTIVLNDGECYECLFWNKRRENCKHRDNIFIQYRECWYLSNSLSEGRIRGDTLFKGVLVIL